MQDVWNCRAEFQLLLYLWPLCMPVLVLFGCLVCNGFDYPTLIDHLVEVVTCNQFGEMFRERVVRCILKVVIANNKLLCFVALL